MNLYELSFAKLIIIRDDVAELIVNEAIEVDLSMIEEYHNLLLSIFNSSFSVLVNKINSYSYTFEAQRQIPALKLIHATDVLTYNNMTEVTTTELTKMSSQGKKWNMKMFSDRDKAIAWLITEQEHLTN